MSRPRSATWGAVSEATVYQRLREHLAYLKLTTAAEQLSGELERAQREQLSVTQVLEKLLRLEVQETRARRQRGRLRFALYPVIQTLAEFDFDFQPSIDRKLVAELSTLCFIPERRNLLLLGPPGVGKSHLAIALGVTATETGYQTYFTSAADMVQNLQAAHLAGNASSTLRLYLRPTVLVIDELGYLPMNQDAANWIFQVVSRRYEKGALIILTSNRGFSDWGQIFAGQVVAAAIVDRLLHNPVALNIRGHSYRMRAYQEAMTEQRTSGERRSLPRRAS